MSNTYPLSPRLTGGELTVNSALANPDRIAARINHLAADSLVASVFFSSSAGLTGGGLLYSPEKPGDLYTTRNVEQRGPGDEYPVVGADVPEMRIARPEDWGGKFFVADEAIKRNLASQLDADVTQLTNTIVRRIDEAALAAVDAGLAEQPDQGVVIGSDWGAVTLDGSTPTDASDRPTADFASVQLAADLDELGVVFDTLVLHPNERAALATIYGRDLADVLASAGLTIRVSKRVTAGTGYAVQAGAAGVLAFEEPLTVKIWADDARRGRWVQGFAVPAIAVTRPRAVMKLTGLAG